MCHEYHEIHLPAPFVFWGRFICGGFQAGEGSQEGAGWLRSQTQLVVRWMWTTYKKVVIIMLVKH